jgi:hypothetical protein
MVEGRVSERRRKEKDRRREGWLDDGEALV